MSKDIEKQNWEIEFDGETSQTINSFSVDVISDEELDLDNISILRINNKVFKLV